MTSSRRAISRVATVGIIIVIIVIAAGAGYFYYTTTSRPTKSPLTNVVMAELGPKTVSTMPVFAAQSFGFFARNGLNVSILLLPDPPTVLRVVVSGQAQIGETTYPTLLSGLQQDQPLKAFMFPQTVQNFFFAVTANITSLSDLKGKVIATAGPGTADHILWGLALKTVGLELDKDVKTIRVGVSPIKYQALLSGRAQGAALVTDFIDLVQHNPKLRVLDVNPNGKYMPYFPFHAFFATSSYEQDHPQVIQAFAKAVIETLRQMVSNETFFAQAVNKVVPGVHNATDIPFLWQTFNTMGYWGVNGGLNFGNLDKSLNIFYEQIQTGQPRKVTTKSYIDTAPVNAVLNQLGVMKASWDTPDWRGS